MIDFQSKVDIYDSRFLDNHAVCCGAAIDDGGDSAWTVSNTLFRNNSASRGGAIYNYGNGVATISDSLFEDNVAVEHGAGR